MEKINDGGPAFPSHGTMGEVVCEGMTLRDYFAAKAMQGMYASDTDSWNANGNEDARAKGAYEMADAMLAAREVQP